MSAVAASRTTDRSYKVSLSKLDQSHNLPPVDPISSPSSRFLLNVEDRVGSSYSIWSWFHCMSLVPTSTTTMNVDWAAQFLIIWESFHKYGNPRLIQLFSLRLPSLCSPISKLLQAILKQTQSSL